MESEPESDAYSSLSSPLYHPVWPGPPRPHPSTIQPHHLMVLISYYRYEGELTWRAISYWAPGCPILWPFCLHQPTDGRTYEIFAYTDDCLTDLYRHGPQSRILFDCRIEAREVVQQTWGTVAWSMAKNLTAMMCPFRRGASSRRTPY